jgi:hypothetical protein
VSFTSEVAVLKCWGIGVASGDGGSVADLTPGTGASPWCASSAPDLHVLPRGPASLHGDTLRASLEAHGPRRASFSVQRRISQGTFSCGSGGEYGGVLATTLAVVAGGAYFTGWLTPTRPSVSARVPLITQAMPWGGICTANLTVSSPYPRKRKYSSMRLIPSTDAEPS